MQRCGNGVGEWRVNQTDHDLIIVLEVLQS